MAIKIKTTIKRPREDFFSPAAAPASSSRSDGRQAGNGRPASGGSRSDVRDADDRPRRGDVAADARFDDAGTDPAVATLDASDEDQRDDADESRDRSSRRRGRGGRRGRRRDNDPEQDDADAFATTDASEQTSKSSSVTAVADDENGSEDTDDRERPRGSGGRRRGRGRGRSSDRRGRQDRGEATDEDIASDSATAVAEADSADIDTDVAVLDEDDDRSSAWNEPSEAVAEADDDDDDALAHPVPTDAPTVREGFDSLGLRSSVLKGVKECGFEHPTEIQARIIPPLLEGRHVLGQAKTGTGKTAAFGLPLLHMCDKETPLQALILVPTRELSQQVQAELNDLGQFTPIRSLAIYGGDPIQQQQAQLRKKPQIIVGTPGRVMDLHQRGDLPYNSMRFVVLDEVDRMLDIGFRDDIRRILGDMPGKPQTIFVSATLSPEIESLAKRHMVDPVKIEALEGALTVDRVEQSYVTVAPWDKPRLLKYLLQNEEPDLTLVFCRMKVTVDKLTASLKRDGIDARAIHGDMPQKKRNQMMERLRAGTLSVIVASDLAARGLDVSGISHVVNYDLPEDPEIYVHRIGRTARAGRHGIAWSFVTPEEGGLLTAIEVFANVQIPSKFYPDFQPGPVPKRVAEEQEQRERDLKKKQEMTKRTAGPSAVWKDDGNAEVDPEKFPGGIVPKKPPKRTLGGRVRPRRR